MHVHWVAEEETLRIISCIGCMLVIVRSRIWCRGCIAKYQRKSWIIPVSNSQLEIKLRGTQPHLVLSATFAGLFGLLRSVNTEYLNDAAIKIRPYMELSSSLPQKRQRNIWSDYGRLADEGKAIAFVGCTISLGL